MRFIAKPKRKRRKVKVILKKDKTYKIIVKPKPLLIKKPLILNYVPSLKKEEIEKEKGKEKKEEKKKEEKKYKKETKKKKPLKPFQRKEERFDFGGLPLPDIQQVFTPLERRIHLGEIKRINISYPLIPEKPRRDEPIFAYAHIYWDENEKELRYKVVEPELTEEEKELIERIKEYIKDKIDIDFTGIKTIEAINYLHGRVNEAIDYFRLVIPDNLLKVIRYYIIRDFLGMEKVEPLMHDENLEDISCDGVNIPIFVVHRDPRLGTLKTNVVFEDKDELDRFVIKLAQRCGKEISIAKPLLDGILPDNSRVQATLSTDIARKGSNFTIRKFSKEPFTPTKEIIYNTFDIKIGAYLWFIINYGRSLLISGGTATGKTSLLNAISIFEKPENKIVTIEDTPELRLPHPNWVPEVAREAISLGGKGSVSLFDLLKESLRQRPDRIIVGEVRGEEAYVLFQAMATGHPGMATIHAESIETLVDRLTTPPISLPGSLLETLDVIIFLTRVKIRNRFVRRVDRIYEIVSVDYKEKRPLTNLLFSWNPREDNFKIVSKSIILERIMNRFGLNKKEIYKDIKARAKLLEWLCMHNVTNYKELINYFKLFYSQREKLKELLKESI